MITLIDYIEIQENLEKAKFIYVTKGVLFQFVKYPYAVDFLQSNSENEIIQFTIKKFIANEWVKARTRPGGTKEDFYKAFAEITKIKLNFSSQFEDFYDTQIDS